MTPKEKAIELVLKFKQRTHYVEVWHTPQLLDKFYHNAISCALIAVDEILKLESNNGYYFDGTNVTSISYWQEVKKEIAKM